MKYKRILSAVLVLLLCVLSMAGCKKKTVIPDDSRFKIYYMSLDERSLEALDFGPEEEEPSLQDVITALLTEPDDPDCKCALPSSVQLLDYTLENGQLHLYFDGAYTNMSRTHEVLCRAAFVRSVCQLSTVDYVMFFVDGQALTDSSRMPVGLMSAESFVDPSSEQLSSYNSVTLTLFFSNAEGEKLVKEVDKLYYSSNMSMEKLVVEQLIRGPVSDHAFACIPQNTKLLSTTTKDGICYVNLSDGFLEQGYDVKEAVPIYAIVNTLCDLPGINKVQILINGETPKVYREAISFETFFERNLDLIEEEYE